MMSRVLWGAGTPWQQVQDQQRKGGRRVKVVSIGGRYFVYIDQPPARQLSRLLECSREPRSRSRSGPEHQRLAVNTSTKWREVNLERFDILKAMLLIEAMANKARLQIHWKTKLIRLLLTPFHEQTARASTLEFWISVKKVKVCCRKRSISIWRTHSTGVTYKDGVRRP